MKIVALKNLHKYCKHYPDAEQALKAWYEKSKKAQWNQGQDIIDEFGEQVVKLIKGNRARFKIKGNKYRLIIAIDYKRSWVFIKFIGTHAEYDQVDAETVNLY